jgi:hypothetical protein
MRPRSATGSASGAAPTIPLTPRASAAAASEGHLDIKKAERCGDGTVYRSDQCGHEPRQRAICSMMEHSFVEIY